MGKRLTVWNSPILLHFAVKTESPFRRYTKGVVMLNSIFEELKSRLLMPDVSRFYGLEINRAGFAACPFHPDNTPSLKFDDSFLRSV